MVFLAVLLTLMFALTSALGALPPPGGAYRIQNVGTGLVFDDHDAATDAGNEINAFRVNNNVPGPLAQRISVQQTGTVLGSTSAGLFKFSFPAIGLGAYVKGPPAAGLGLNAQNFSTEFAVTEVSESAGTYTITYPFSDFAVTSPTEAIMQLTLQALNASEPRQQWRFILFA
ncbi:hypothetical protein AURDEDRAFT_171438 [Auricularia subglabra TFB-10046 SS5]|nr:hypothetical protein AURDEDRAFT_171438 [Auricularia subglabra TFB-10046 SS5]